LLQVLEKLSRQSDQLAVAHGQLPLLLQGGALGVLLFFAALSDFSDFAGFADE